MFTYVACVYVFLHVIRMHEAMVRLCLSGINPQHLAVIDSFLSRWSPKRPNHTLYGKQSIFGSHIHSIWKPQIAPIKPVVSHTDTHACTQTHDRLILSRRSMSQVAELFLSDRNQESYLPPITRDHSMQRVCVFCVWMKREHASMLSLCFYNTGASLIVLNVSCRTSAGKMSLKSFKLVFMGCDIMCLVPITYLFAQFNAECFSAPPPVWSLATAERLFPSLSVVCTRTLYPY